MPVTSYPNLLESLNKVSSDSNLYARVAGKAVEYYHAQAILEDAKRSNDPCQIQFQEQLEGRFQDL